MNEELPWNPTEGMLPEPCPGCGLMLDDQGCDVDGRYHYGPEGCANYPNNNGWRDKGGGPCG